MAKLLRTLIEDEQISLVAIDSTELVRHAQIIHNMTAEAARVFGRILTVATYMSCWLKDEDSQISVNFKHHGETGEACVSGDGAMHMRGYIYNPLAHDETIGKGYMTVVRDDHYKTPFVGTCEMVGGDVDENFEYYYRLSEQLPTYIATDAAFDEHGLCLAAGGIFLQPMPGADEVKSQYAKNAAREVKGFAKELKNAGMGALIEKIFGVKTCEEREIEYRCSCSREYIAGVLHGMGENELREILRTEGKINVHCHYCNSDYDFYEKDIDEMFSSEKK
jgi:molecular chaperone Hsp33